MRRSMYSRLAGLFLLCCATIAQAAEPGAKVSTDKDLGFFTATREETLGGLKRLGLLPVRPPEGMEDRQDVKAALQSLVIQYLGKAGIELVPPDAYEKIYDRLNHQLGGIYNAETGATRVDRMQAVVDNTRREFIESEHLDGYVIVRVLLEKANFSRAEASWDGVRERSSGRLPANALSSLLLTDDTHSGSLPAFSLAVQISNVQNKIVFGRLGGIQLTSYFDIQKSKGVNGFLLVPVNDLLRDVPRLERAVRVTTLPLLYSAEQIAAGDKDPAINPGLIKLADLPPVPAGAEPRVVSPLRVPREQILGTVHRVALASLAVGQFKIDDPIRQRYLELIRAEVQGMGWELVDAPAARDLFNAELVRSGGLFDPYTGKRDEARLSAIRRAVIPALGLTPAPDAILYPSVVRTMAPFDGGAAQWDGVGQSAIDLGPVRKPGFWVNPAAQAAGEGAIQAASLNIQLASADDTELYQSRGGIQLLQQLKGKQRQTLTPEELFRDPARDQAAVHAALRDLTLTATQLEAELHPDRKAASR